MNNFCKMLAILLCCCTIVACGQTGRLYLPSEQAQDNNTSQS